MKELDKLKKPVMKITKFTNEDIIATSTPDHDEPGEIITTPEFNVFG